MPSSALLLSPEGRRTANRLLEVLQGGERYNRAAASDPSILEPGGVESRLVLVERAKGALMHHYGIDPHQAFAVLIGWARESRTPVATIAQTLLRGICEGNPQTEVRQRALVRWLELKLRDSDPDMDGSGRLVGSGPGDETPRSGGAGTGVCRGAWLTQTRAPAPHHRQLERSRATAMTRYWDRPTDVPHAATGAHPGQRGPGRELSRARAGRGRGRQMRAVDAVIEADAR